MNVSLQLFRSVRFEEGHYLMMATRKGLVKKTPIQDYANVRKTGLAAIITSG